MGLGTAANDWQCVCVLQAGGAAGAGGGAFMFDWYSPTANLSARFELLAGGVGAGGNLTGASLPDAWSTVSCNQSFCVYDLDGADGWIESLSIGVGVQYSVTYISARVIGGADYLFEDQSVGGFSLGASAGVFALVGSWQFARVVANKPPVPWWA
jgi:hypothetical protein